MDKVDSLLKDTVAELDRLLNAKNVLGDPIERDGAMIIPIVSYGFGFGAGGSTGGKSGSSGGSGAGGGIRPIGAIIVDGSGARVEAIKGTVDTLIHTVAEAANKAMDRKSGPDDPQDG